MSEKGSVAIITAASKGMGAATARELAKRGYKLVLLSTSDAVVDLAKELGATGVKGSVTVPADLKRLVDTTIERHGRIDALVNNTGHPPKAELLTLTDDEWYRGLDITMMNVVRMARLVTPHMEARGGAIVNVSAFGAVEPGLGFPVSSVGRAALSAYTKLYATRYAASKIRMNSILPGFIDTWPATPETIAQIPAGRFGTVAEIAGAVAFLLSEDAGFITGQNILVDGGMVRGI